MYFQQSAIHSKNPVGSNPSRLVVKQIDQHYRRIVQLFAQDYETEDGDEMGLYLNLKKTFKLNNEQLTSLLQEFLTTFQQPSTKNKISSCRLQPSMTFMQMVEVIVEGGMDPTDLFRYLDSIQVESKQDLLQVNAESFHPKETKDYYQHRVYFQQDISQLFIQVVCNKLDCDQSLTDQERDLLDHICQHQTSSEQIRRSYYLLRQKLQLDQYQAGYFVNQFKSVQQKLLVLASKQPHQQIIYRQFEKADSTRSGRMNYSLFSETLMKLKMTLLESEVNTLFRYAMYVETGSLHQLISRTYFINYSLLLDTIFNRAVQKEQAAVSNQVSHHKLTEYQTLLRCLKTEKEEMSQLLTGKENRIQNLQSKLLEYQLQSSSRQNSVSQIVKNERATLKLKYQGEVGRLRKVNENQKQMIDSYRVELENIMSEIHHRQI